jgi:hypothetical protein
VERRRNLVDKITYEIIEHNGGWAYRVADVISETHDTRQEALDAAERAAFEHRIPGPDEHIEYEDARGRWHEEEASGTDRPQTTVEK